MTRALTLLALLLIFFPIPLAVLGWNWASDSAPGWMKIHPATYLLVVGTAFALLSAERRHWRVIGSWRYGPYILMSLVLTGWAVMIAGSSNDPSGAVGIALTSFFTPAMLLVCLPSVTRADLSIVRTSVRTLLVVNSLLALGEVALHRTVFFVQEGSQFRAGGLFGHPLASASITGYMLVYLLSATNRRGPLPLVAAEVVLHAAAMFAFGSRTGLILVPFVLMLAALLPSFGKAGRFGLMQRVAVVAVLAIAIGISQLDVDFVQRGLSRFANDAGSADSRWAVVGIVGRLDWHSLLWGLDMGLRLMLMAQYNLLAIEIAWIALTFTFGLVFVVPLAISLFLALFSVAARLDRSAVVLTLYFLIASTSSVSFGTKSTGLALFILFMLAFTQPAAVTSARRRVQPRREGSLAISPRPAIGG